MNYYGMTAWSFPYFFCEQLFLPKSIILSFISTDSKLKSVLRKLFATEIKYNWRLERREIVDFSISERVHLNERRLM